MHVIWDAGKQVPSTNLADMYSRHDLCKGMFQYTNVLCTKWRSKCEQQLHYSTHVRNQTQEHQHGTLYCESTRQG
jgi:hypothetical protein